MKKYRHNFTSLPQVRFPRSQQLLGHSITTSMTVGKLYPIEWLEVVPGDTFKSKMFDVQRVTSSFLKPVMDNLFLDVYHFFVPYRLLYANAENVFGNPSPSAYQDNDLDEFPMNYGGDEVKPGSVGDYLGLPLGTYSANCFSILPFRAFAKIWNYWFRNENVMDEVFVQGGSVSTRELCGSLPWGPNSYAGELPPVAKYKDYFTSCLPSPQKGAPVSLSIGGTAPVYTGAETYSGSGVPLKFSRPASGNVPLVMNNQGELYYGNESYSAGLGSSLSPINLYADLSSATASSVNDQRFAFALQKMLERDALYGSRYNEFLLGHFGVYAPDQRLQIPEYLGGGRTPLNVTQVAQTSQPSEESPLGAVAGYSWTNGKTRYTKSFVEHGLVMTVACVRYRHTYQQGLPRKWTRKAREDFYDPLFATIGQQPVYQSELYYNPTASSPVPGSAQDPVFGYNEAWADYRTVPSFVTGQARSSSGVSLDLWHFADNYSDPPTLSSAFISETPSFVDRTLSVSSDKQDNFIIQFYNDLVAYRPMPVRSVPGLIDHH